MENALKSVASDVQFATQEVGLGHVAIHSRKGETELAARLFKLLGCPMKRFGPSASGDSFYIISLNACAPSEPHDIVFLAAMNPHQAALENELLRLLGVGTQAPNECLTKYMEEKAREPEFFSHFGIHFKSLADLEAAALRLEAAVQSEPDFQGRIQAMQVLKARSGRDREIDARMAASSVFSRTAREAYGQNIVQIHLTTDLFTTGLSFLGSVLELDYTFQGVGRERNTFNDLIMD